MSTASRQEQGPYITTHLNGIANGNAQYIDTKVIATDTRDTADTYAYFSAAVS